MRETRFGKMERLSFPVEVALQFEVMHFRYAGTPHQHKRDEFAVVVSGRGTVWVDGVAKPANPGRLIHIPGGASHHMEPDDGQVLHMLIAYAATPATSE